MEDERLNGGWGGEGTRETCMRIALCQTVLALCERKGGQREVRKRREGQAKETSEAREPG